jgi:hypothetical protein
MVLNSRMTKPINNKLNGHHFNSAYWQNYKKSLPPLSNEIFEIAVGMILGDATMYRVSREALIKFEQGYKQKEFLFHLFDIFSPYCFMQKPGVRFQKNGTVKSFWFKTFSFSDFTRVFLLFFDKNEKKQKKRIVPGLIRDFLTPKGLAYWIMCDGSLQKDNRSMILHTQSFSLEENLVLRNELNAKFNFHARVILHKERYYALFIPKQDGDKLAFLIKKELIRSMLYKCPHTGTL